jgi:molecular chaperone GrpE
MSDPHREDPGAPPEEGQVKVIDRRRFRPDGEPLADDRPADSAAPDPASAAAPEAEPDPRDAQLAAQAARIDELSRAYAALVEDNKAFRGRLERDRTRAIEAERAGVAQVLLEAADDLERALAAVTGAGEPEDEVVRNLAEGVRLTLGSLHQRIAETGAERVSLLGQRFDPRMAEAVDVVTVSDEAQDGCVVQEIRPGYRIGERILRPARVRVGRLAQA